jgi:hypothetical protein
LGQSIVVLLCEGSTLLLTQVVRLGNSQPTTPSEVTSFSYWSIKPWFLSEGKLAAVLITPSSWDFLTAFIEHTPSGANKLCGGAKGKMSPRVKLYNLEDEVVQPLYVCGSIFSHTRGSMVQHFTVHFGNKEVTASMPRMSENVQAPLARRGGRAEILDPQNSDPPAVVSFRGNNTWFSSASTS